jgi:hypothetical protein
MSLSNALIEDVSPVSDNLLGELYRSNPQGLPALIHTVPESVRATLAIFCYRRAHLQGLAIAIASSCAEEDLIAEGGFLGSILIAKSRPIKQHNP